MKKVSSLLSFLESEVASLNRKNKLGLAENYRYSGNSFRHYLETLHRHDVPLSRVSAELLIAYQQWLLDRGIQRNTSAFYMRNLQAVYNKAVSQGLVTDRKPFADVCTTITHTEKRAVSTPLIRALSTLDIAAGLVRLGHDPRKKPFLRMLRDLTFARDTFIFCFCARGLTFVDFAYLRCENIRHGSLVYARRKTGQCLEVAIQSQMQAFLDRYALSSGPYLFPVLTSTNVHEAHRQYASALRRYNKHLDKLSLMLGLSHSLSSYVSRHSWATAAYHANLPVSHISEGMGVKKYLQRKIDEQKNIFRFEGLSHINERQRYVLQAISDSKRVLFTPKELATQFDVSPKSARTDLQELVKMGYLTATNLNRRAIGYIKSDKFERLLSEKSNSD